MKTKPKLKARRMWANYKTTTSHPRVFCTADDCHGDNEWTDHARVAVPVAVIPLDDVPALVRAAGDAFAASYDGHLCKSDIVAMLTAIGVLPEQRKGRK